MEKSNFLFILGMVTISLQDIYLISLGGLSTFDYFFVTSLTVLYGAFLVLSTLKRLKINYIGNKTK